MSNKAAKKIICKALTNEGNLTLYSEREEKREREKERDLIWWNNEVFLKSRAIMKTTIIEPENKLDRVDSNLFKNIGFQRRQKHYNGCSAHRDTQL